MGSAVAGVGVCVVGPGVLRGHAVGKRENDDVIARVLRQVETQLQRGYWDIARAALDQGIQELQTSQRREAATSVTPMATLRLPAKLVNALEEHLNIIYVGDLLQYTAEQVQQQPNIGDTMVRELSKRMAEIGVQWGAVRKRR